MTTVFTAGHGNRPLREFVSLLESVDVRCLVDVRAFPASRRHPQFERAALERGLALAGIRYQWEGRSLGGRRKAAADSPHAALRNPGFRGFADHMASDAFRAGVRRIEVLAGGSGVAIMCAERLPWQCHRQLISDYLVAAGISVVHLIGEEAAREHRLNPLARLREGRLVYDGETQNELKL